MLLPDEPVLDAADGLVASPSRRRLARGMGWATFDQAVSSCTNFGITVVAARQLSRHDFGAFGLAVSVSIVVMGLARSLATEPLLSRPELAAGSRQRATFGAVLGAAAGLGGTAAVAVFVAGVLLGHDVGRALVALAVILPGMCLQDACRYCFLSQGRGAAATLNDGLWLLAQALAVTGLAAASHWSPTSILTAWGGAGAAAAILGLFQAGALPRLSDGWSWLTAQRVLGGRYCIEFVIANGATQVALVGLGAMAGLSALGAVRGAQTFFGPLGVLFSGILLAVVPIATGLRDQPGRMRRLITVICVGVCLCAAAWTVVGLALPRRIGREMFGDSWASIHDLILPLGLMLVASGVVSGPYAGLRALAAARESLRARVLTLPLVLGATLVGAAFDDAVGFSYGLAVASLAMAAIYWWQFSLANTPAHGRT